ncbi:MAG: glycoside hydrolase family 32 protein [Anaerolineales bacterium]
MTMITRPAYHFTLPQNFMNDPNGLVFFKNEYHLFYQHNPFDNVWGHMSWGHAVSHGLVHWEHLPVALYEEDDIIIFSGSAIADHQNTSRLGSSGQPPMIAIYTGHTSEKQTQNIAYSTDCGRTWTKYKGNPLLDIGSSEFRDPKVLWHEPTRQWIMLTVLADQHKIRFDGSLDLKRWTYLSEFGPAGSVNGLWECPDLFLLPVEDQPEISKWILKVDEQNGIGAQYFTGDFDGRSFINDAPSSSIFRVDYGNDFYAAQSWSDTPDGRRIWVGWLNNWAYANVIPTSPWRGLFSIPRELRLRKYPEGFGLIQQPIPELKVLRQPICPFTGIELAAVNAQLAELEPGISQEIKAEFTLDTDTAHEFGIRICTGDSEQTVIGYDSQAQVLFVDRRRSGDETAFSPEFAGLHSAPLSPEQGKIAVHIFVDSCSLEVFGNNGRVVISDLIFPDSRSAKLELYAIGADVQLNTLEIWQMDKGFRHA